MPKPGNRSAEVFSQHEAYGHVYINIRVSVRMYKQIMYTYEARLEDSLHSRVAL